MTKKTELAADDLEPMDLEEALRFLVKLANAKIDELKRRPDDPEGLPAILYGLRRYFNLTGEGRLRSALDKARNHPDDLKKPIADLKGLLDAVVEGRLEDTEFTLTKPRTIQVALKGNEFIALRSGDLRESIIEDAIEDFDETEAKLLRLGHCQRNGCGKLFYKMKINQNYCDHRCANRAAADRRAAKTRARVPKGPKATKQEATPS